MAFYVDEEEVWKCPKHPSKRRRSGICHVCLRERLSSLCPDCANVRPCECYATTSSSSGSSSFSLSRFSAAAGVGRVSSVTEREPSFRRSRSLAVSFLRSKPSVEREDSPSTKPAPSFWTLWKSSFNNGSKSKRFDLNQNDVVLDDNGEVKKKLNKKQEEEEEERRRMMRKSRSVAVTSDLRAGDVRVSSKGRGWHFPSPMKALRQSISRGILQERSPMHRG